MKAGALFSGIGGFCYGFADAQIPTAWSVEFDKSASETYAHNFPDTRLITKDIRTVTVAGDKLEPVDVLHAGFPCQSFSQAGEKNGFNDDRGKLFFEIIRLLSEFGKDKPKIIVLENAPFLRYGEGGAWFLRIQNEIRKAGYWFRDDNSAELNTNRMTLLPQQRVRLFMVALSTDAFPSGKFNFPKSGLVTPQPLEKFIDFENDVDPEYYLPKDNRYHKMISDAMIGDRQIYQLRKYFVRTKEPGICPTLTANMGLGGHNVPFVWGPSGLRKLTEYECAALQGFPKSFTFPTTVPRAKRYTQIGNAVAPPMARLIAEKVRDRISGGSFQDVENRLRVPA